MIDIRDHGGNFGGGGKKDFLPKDLNRFGDNYSPLMAYVHVKDATMINGFNCVGFDDTYAWGWTNSNSSVVIYDRRTGTIVKMNSFASISTALGLGGSLFTVQYQAAYPNKRKFALSFNLNGNYYVITVDMTDIQNWTYAKTAGGFSYPTAVNYVNGFLYTLTLYNTKLTVYSPDMQGNSNNEIYSVLLSSLYPNYTNGMTLNFWEWREDRNTMYIMYGVNLVKVQMTAGATSVSDFIHYPNANVASTNTRIAITEDQQFIVMLNGYVFTKKTINSDGTLPTAINYVNPAHSYSSAEGLKAIGNELWTYAQGFINKFDLTTGAVTQLMDVGASSTLGIDARTLFDYKNKMFDLIRREDSTLYGHFKILFELGFK